MKVGIRWTIGDVSRRGFEALGLSIRGAWKIFGSNARYAVVVNSLTVAEARQLTGEVPAPVTWLAAESRMPAFLKGFVDPGMAEGVAWKLAPLRVFADLWELSLDNDCILWELPRAVDSWLRGRGEGCLLEADVTRCFGQFDADCPSVPLNTGIRGFSPGFDPATALAEMLRLRPLALHTETDEQGFQVAAYCRHGPVTVVDTDDVSICSPFYPHQPDPGRCGAHFVGLNARQIPWDYYGRPALEWRIAHWQRLLPRLREYVECGSPLPL